MNQLTADLIKGDRKAFEKIYCNCHDRLYHFAREYVSDHEEAMDIVQNVFTKLWQRKEELNPSSNLEAWLFTVTRNECLSLLDHKRIVMTHRENEKKKLQEINLLALKSLKLTDDTLFNILDIINECLEQMPPKCRKVFLMSREGRMNYREISRQLSISVKTVESHMLKALRILRNALSDYLNVLVTIMFL